MTQFYGLDELDRRIATIVTQRSGFFVEVGAHDGLSQTNSLYFEKIGWRGLLIEPIPELYRRCLVNRPACRTVNCCCTSLDDPRTEIAMTYAGLMSIVQGHKAKADEDAWTTRGAELQELERYTTLVPAAPLASVLAREGVGRVDLLIVDVEGYEIPLLNGLDYTALRPRWIVCEDAYTNDVSRFLLDRGYRLESTLVERRFTRDQLYADVQSNPSTPTSGDGITP